MNLTEQTAARYGHLWSRSNRAPRRAPSSYHFEQLAASLPLPPLQGVVLDAGCGEGIDLANQAGRPNLELVGIELSAGGCRASAERVRGLAGVSVIQGDLTALPFADGTFDFIYSYGVLHHLPEPAQGLRELVRALKPGCRLALYLYEDFSDRRLAWRSALRMVNAVRRLTMRMPPRLLEGFCRAAAPAVFLTCVIPYRIARRLPGASRLAERIPFRHGTGPWSLWGDLYDRFSAPVEHRYSRAGAIALIAGCGLQEITAANQRGWILMGTKPERRLTPWSPYVMVIGAR